MCDLMLQNYKKPLNGTKKLDDSNVFIDKRVFILNKKCCIPVFSSHNLPSSRKKPNFAHKITRLIKL